uniref:Uncharacterized protein n=1 Tax=Phytophthora ramorum TaxID=164328 RepID=H3HAR6_PHYRM
MADFRDATSSDDEQQGGAAWETAPDNDDEQEGSDEDNGFSDRNYQGDASDGDFEDAWLDDYLPDASDSLQHEKQTLRAEVEKARGDSAADQERLRHLNEKLHQLNEKLAQLSEKQLQLDAVERDNRTLKEETQKYEMQALSSNELVKTLRDQLTLTTKSEEQLKLQTKQLMEQNQSLQADLLEKIASETTKFQKMAKLSAENESLMEELERKENAMSERELEARMRMRGLVIHSLLRSKGRDMLHSALFQWSGAAQNVTSARTRAFVLLLSVGRSVALRLKAAALSKIKQFAIVDRHVETATKLQFATTRDNNRGNLERVQQLEASLAEAKECVFSLSQCGSELQLVKHGFVTTVIRDAERAWLRMLLVQWRIQTHVSAVTKELRLQVEIAELKAAERDKYSKSLDDYSRVLRSDLERFQFFSLDKRITVDVLSKKLLREEERYRHMEERHVALEERAHALKTQLSSFVEWDGLALPFSVLTLCKDVAVSNLRELFQLHAAADSAVVGEGVGTRGVDANTPSPRLAMSSLVRILEYSTLLEENVIERDVLAERLARHLPPYAVERGLLFADFVTGLNQFLTDVFAASNTKLEQLKRHLSDDILQNQEKLLAVLEHETAVVEPNAPPTGDLSMEVYANWHLTPQVRDLFLAFHSPLLKLLVQYSAIFRMLTDLKLHPTFLSRDVIQTNQALGGAKEADQHWRMRLDEFYIAISYVQAERSPGTAYATPGEAVRQWLQQTQ